MNIPSVRSRYAHHTQFSGFLFFIYFFFCRTCARERPAPASGVSFFCCARPSWRMASLDCRRPLFRKHRWSAIDRKSLKYDYSSNRQQLKNRHFFDHISAASTVVITVDGTVVPETKIFPRSKKPNNFHAFKEISNNIYKKKGNIYTTEFEPRP